MRALRKQFHLHLTPRSPFFLAQTNIVSHRELTYNVIDLLGRSYLDSRDRPQSRPCEGRRKCRYQRLCVNHPFKRLYAGRHRLMSRWSMVLLTEHFSPNGASVGICDGTGLLRRYFNVYRISLHGALTSEELGWLSPCFYRGMHVSKLPRLGRSWTFWVDLPARLRRIELRSWTVITEEKKGGKRDVRVDQSSSFQTALPRESITHEIRLAERYRV